jgi:hypothetical protein
MMVKLKRVDRLEGQRKPGVTGRGARGIVDSVVIRGFVTNRFKRCALRIKKKMQPGRAASRGPVGSSQ